MGFMGLPKFGHKDSVNDFTDVLVPMTDAKRHPDVIAEYQRRVSKEGARPDAADVTGANDEKKDGRLSDTEGGLPRTSSGTYSPYTVEGLKAEIHEDVSASEHNTAYDCNDPLVPIGEADINY
jgi:hypothetical protein